MKFSSAINWTFFPLTEMHNSCSLLVILHYFCGIFRYSIFQIVGESFHIVREGFHFSRESLQVGRENVYFGRQSVHLRKEVCVSQNKFWFENSILDFEIQIRIVKSNCLKDKSAEPLKRMKTWMRPGRASIPSFAAVRRIKWNAQKKDKRSTQFCGKADNNTIFWIETSVFYLNYNLRENKNVKLISNLWQFNFLSILTALHIIVSCKPHNILRNK